MAKLYQLVFEGETLDGFDADQVRQQIGEHLKLDDARLEHLFSGRRVVLKRGVDEERAHRHKRQFAHLGGRLLIEDDGAGADPARSSEHRTPRPAPPPPRRPREEPAATAPSTLPGIAEKGLAPMSGKPAPRPAPLPAEPMLALVPAEDDSITCPHCGEVQPKAVFCRACTTNMPMGIAAREEAQAKARAEKRAAGGGSLPPTTMTRIEAGRGLAEQAPSLFGFGFRGRLSKRGYAMGIAIAFLLGWLLVLFVSHRPGVGRLLLALLLGVPVSVFYLRLCVLRCHDINRSGWWALALAVPVIGFVAALVLALVPSTDGDNAYGEMPDEGSKTLTQVVTGVCALAIAFLVKPALNRIEVEEATAAATAAAGPPKLEDAADRAYHVDYAASPGHKAFAITTGAFGWKASAETSAEAEDAALAACEAQRPQKSPPCDVVNVNGEWMPRYGR